jgi:tRNA-Thr(GGU) m(6)t(6)A37 methyltransferase TsaA
VTDDRYELVPIGWVESPLVDPSEAPNQGDEGAPDAWLVVDAGVGAAMQGLEVGDRVVVVTWLHRADRRVLEVHPRGDPTRPMRGVFATRSPDRPNPVGLHEVHVLAVEDHRIRVAGLEAIHGTPVLDIKPVLGPVGER